MGGGIEMLALKARRVRVRSAATIGAALICASALLFAPEALAAAPAATTGAASGVTYESAVVAGSVNPGSESTVVYFQYGTTAEYGAQSAPTQVAAGKKAVPVSVTISGLAAGTIYHYRLVASNATGTALGAGRTVTTAKIPLSLAIAAAPSVVTVGGATTIEGTLSGTGNAGAAVQLQQNPFPYTAGFVDVGNPELTLANGTFAFNVLGVAANTQYRVVSGTVASADVVVSAALGVTLHAQAGGTHRHPTIRFSGSIAPAEPSARIGFERLIGTNWKVVGGTIAGATMTNGVVHFGKTITIRSGGFFRALVLPVEGAHVSGYSQTVTVRIR
jgi:hypothetical protein